MSSLLTNTSAMTALRTLAATQKSLAGVQDQVSTGLRVAKASDDAAYWSISTAMKSQVSAVGAVQDALNLTSSVADVTATALTHIISNVQGIEKDLVTAQTPGVDRSAVQQDISAKQGAIIATANAASFNGVNWLVQNKTADVTITESHTLSVPTSTIISEGSSTAHTQAADPMPTAPPTQNGTRVYSTQPSPTPYAFTDRISYQATATETDSTGTTKQETDTFNGIDQDNAYSSSFWVGQGGTWQAATQLNIYRSQPEAVTASNYSQAGSVDFTDSQTFRVPGSQGDSLVDINVSSFALFTNYTGSMTVTESTDSGTYAYDWVGTHSPNSSFTSTTSYASYNTDNGFEENLGALDINIGGTDASSNRGVTPEDNLAMSSKTTVLNFTIDDSNSAHYASNLSNMHLAVSATLSALTTMAAQVGAVQNHIAIQKDFNSALSGALTSGIGSLVDADMNVASTRLQALQTQQQLGIQALSIANDNSKEILKLFG